MSEQSRTIERLLFALQERAKELNCLYAVEELLNDSAATLDEIFNGIVKAIPPGWQYPDICQARIIYQNTVFAQEDFQETDWALHADIQVADEVVGGVDVYYTREMPTADVGPFHAEEVRLIKTIADRLGHFVQYQQLRWLQHEWQSAKKNLSEKQKPEWRVLCDFLHHTDQNLCRRITRKMFIRLCSSGIREAESLQDEMPQDSTLSQLPQDENRPMRRRSIEFTTEQSNRIFDIAATYFSDQEILLWIQKWIQEDKSSFLVMSLESFSTSIGEIVDAVRKFHHLAAEGEELAPSTDKELRVALISRFFTDQLEYINIAKDHVELSDFYDLVHRIIFPTDSHGKLGGKSAGLFLASRILQRASQEQEILENMLTPKTWYITSDAQLRFITYNNLEELVEHKYREIDEIRREYGQIVQIFKHSSLTPEVVQGLSMALDDFQNRPLIVRSSSLLEDRFGSPFSGKYKSLFLANQGTKPQRLEALLDAIAEVYSSTFGPDPIQYRHERGLLDFREEMGIMIQEVVGTHVGRYFLPAYAGVAFSNNEFRWSPRIRREDGLIRLVPGLGTRAVDRLSDDYPILLAPGQPGLRVNITTEEVARYSPHKMDVIDLEANAFVTIDVRDFFREYGHQIPWLNQAISICDGDHLQVPSGLTSDLKRTEFCVTFEGLISRTPFVKQVGTILRVLQEKLHTPVDIEFASDGKTFYLLQCRPQVYGKDTAPSPIPHDVHREQIVFTANRYISNGRAPDCTHIVYVDPLKYAEIGDLSTLKEVGRCVGQLNKVLPKRQFVLMGPGRWGSRGDIKLGVSVTYADISNTAMLIEIARQRGNYLPDLSFGTHFFQDLVESSIRYLPLYPDDPKVIFNENFLGSADNILPGILPEFASLANTVRVIDVPKSSGGRVLRVLMNADRNEAMGLLALPRISVEEIRTDQKPVGKGQPLEEHWRWRMQMAEHIAEHLDADRFGVKAMYVFGSAKNATAGPGSDIDLLVHFAGTEQQQEMLRQWLEGWSLCLSEMNYLRTGVKAEKLLDVHIITDEDIAARSPFAVKIGAVTDAARPLPLGCRSERFSQSSNS
ncbi:MAG: PEP/pyruvate-binding domain-containing protein [bacterium]